MCHFDQKRHCFKSTLLFLRAVCLSLCLHVFAFCFLTPKFILKDLIPFANLKKNFIYFNIVEFWLNVLKTNNSHIQFKALYVPFCLLKKLIMLFFL